MTKGFCPSLDELWGSGQLWRSRRGFYSQRLRHHSNSCLSRRSRERERERERERGLFSHRYLRRYRRRARKPAWSLSAFPRPASDTPAALARRIPFLSGFCAMPIAKAWEQTAVAGMKTNIVWAGRVCERLLQNFSPHLRWERRPRRYFAKQKPSFFPFVNILEMISCTHGGSVRAWREIGRVFR